MAQSLLSNCYIYVLFPLGILEFRYGEPCSHHPSPLLLPHSHPFNSSLFTYLRHQTFLMYLSEDVCSQSKLHRKFKAWAETLSQNYLKKEVHFFFLTLFLTQSSSTFGTYLSDRDVVCYPTLS